MSSVTRCKGLLTLRTFWNKMQWCFLQYPQMIENVDLASSLSPVNIKRKTGDCNSCCSAQCWQKNASPIPSLLTTKRAGNETRTPRWTCPRPPKVLKVVTSPSYQEWNPSMSFSIYCSELLSYLDYKLNQTVLNYASY